MLPFFASCLLAWSASRACGTSHHWAPLLVAQQIVDGKAPDVPIETAISRLPTLNG
jgi:hypothetical protein